MAGNRLADKVAIITGAGRGMGRAGALAFAREGARVMVADIIEENAKETVSLIKTEGLEANYLKIDVTSSDDCQRLIEQTIAWAGRVDIVYNNAGISIAKRTEDYTLEDFERVIGINLRGPFMICKYVLPHMRERGSGVIVNTGSINSLGSTNPLHAVYNASKAGILGLTKGIAMDYAQYGIRANLLCPTYTSTPMVEGYFNSLEDPAAARREVASKHPLGRIATPDDIAKAALFLASDEAAFITGITLIVDGGLTSRFA
ncbi:MAG: SDR family oxidoreductase [Chloroflexota bacterium]|nr:MAG: SDR family oxidoreductase [Chloroflexota bacterium]